MKKDLVLIADDDEDIIKFVEVNLRLDGFEVITASDGNQALERATEAIPDLILLDVMMPKMNGVEVCQRLRSDGRTKNISVIMLTAKAMSADKIVGLTAGADDYIIKPFDPAELVARVKSALRRSREMRGMNPLTQLPGNHQIDFELQRRVEKKAPFALMHIDIDNFKAFNDHYGFLRGDQAITLLARCSSDATGASPSGDGFLGHVGGDDFVALVPPEDADDVAQDIIDTWDRNIQELYDKDDAELGYIEVPDRQKQMHRYVFCTLSIGIATNLNREIASHWEASQIASEMRGYAKRTERSSYAIDRRQTDEDQPKDPWQPA